MKEATDQRYRATNLGGDLIRVVIYDDVIALPSEGWAHCGFGQSISVDWLLHSANHRLPGSKRRRVALARVIAEALWDHHHDGPIPAHLLETS